MAGEIQKLFLEDCLDDAPQTRTMVEVFEKDAQMLKKFSKAFASSCQKVLNAQVAMISATQEMSYYLRLYGMQNFPLDPSVGPSEGKTQNSSIAANLNQFANYVDEISTCFQVFVTQLNDSMVYPLNKFIDNEFDELTSSEKMYQISSEEDELTRQKYLKIPNRKEYEQQRIQANEECFAFRKKFHESGLNYFSSLNSLQFKRQYMFIEPMMSFVHTMKLFFKMGSETFSPDSSSKIDEFLNTISTHVCDVKVKQMENMEKTNNLIDLLQQDSSIYFAERTHDHANRDLKNSNILQKSGYLNLRSGQDRDEWIYILENAIKTDNKIKLESHMKNLKLNNPSLLEQLAGKTGLNLLKKPEIRFELDSSVTGPSLHDSESHNDQAESFKVRFLGSMDVKSDRGNEYITETIRKVMSARAEQRFFNLSEFDMVIDTKFANLFKVAQSAEETSSKLNNIDDLLSARFKLDNIGYWASYPENERLFGIIVKDRGQNLKLSCHVFESDVSSKSICETITRATQEAFRELVESNRSEHLKVIKKREKEILLANIGKLPDKQENEDDGTNNESEEDRNALMNVAELAFASPNPNFIVLDREILEYIDDNDLNESGAKAEKNTIETNTESEA
ncbi:DCC-interacting 13-alpha-like [Brachionus plicatilis]|uniref:DCC-interacting 13-alpha-like n=1 Tax=Brachionus plicatilis TaxID=10195 RepID=A0A3M7PQ90_BRAPC|nr:DCC-interacting 13-alpha-like [Brachionus plicatilis]